MNPGVEAKKLTLRYSGTCKVCGKELAKGSVGYHFKTEKKVACTPCVEAHSVKGVDTTSSAGASAQREFDRRSQAREQHLVDQWGTLGRVAAAITDDPQTTRAWSNGAKGERKVADHLEKKLAGSPCRILHDRQRRGQANFDHLVVGPAGVTVIDTKEIVGNVRAVSHGFGKRRRTELEVNGRKQTKLIAKVKTQVSAVEAALQEASPPITVTVVGCICWRRGEGLPLISDIEIDGVRVIGPKGAAKYASRAGSLTSVEIDFATEFLAQAFPPA